MTQDNRAYWIGIASAEHVRCARDDGYAQVCNGKQGPLKRMKPGDGMLYYSPNLTFGGKERCQSFTAIGLVREGEPYRFDMGGGFIPYRRDVDWMEAQDMPIRPLLEELDFTMGRRSWGYAFRFGLFTIGEHDFRTIAAGMQARLPF